MEDGKLTIDTLAQATLEGRSIPLTAGPALVTQQPANQASLEAVIIRCHCGEPSAHTGRPCPYGSAEPLGTIAYYHRSPWKRLKYRLARLFHRRATFWEK